MIQGFVAAFSERAHRTGLGRLEFYIKENSGQAVQVYEGKWRGWSWPAKLSSMWRRIPRLQRFHFSLKTQLRPASKNIWRS